MSRNPKPRNFGGRVPRKNPTTSTRPSYSRAQVEFNPPAATSDLDLTRVAVFGHSYVRELEFELRPVQRDDQCFSVRKFYVSGGTVDRLGESEELKRLVLFRPHVTYLIVGGNDVRLNVSPRELATSIQTLAQGIERDTGGKVRIVGLESRTNPRGMTAEEYNKIKNSVNRIMKRSLGWTRTRYTSMNMSKDELRDGVHLNFSACRELTQRLVDDVLETLKGGQ